MWYDVIVEKIKKLNTKVKEVVITVNPIDVNSVIGQKRQNINNLKAQVKLVLLNFLLYF